MLENDGGADPHDGQINSAGNNSCSSALTTRSRRKVAAGSAALTTREQWNVAMIEDGWN